MAENITKHQLVRIAGSNSEALASKDAEHIIKKLAHDTLDNHRASLDGGETQNLEPSQEAKQLFSQIAQERVAKVQNPNLKLPPSVKEKLVETERAKIKQVIPLVVDRFRRENPDVDRQTLVEEVKKSPELQALFKEMSTARLRAVRAQQAS
mmetsp:Transcript_35800/g.77436  ORF Transcript_35800/g.77436 Transcript_35800/m.77436 type:complete len:152 (+) Transcript_35800:383-838(+)